MEKYSPPPINFPKPPVNNPYSPAPIFHQPRPSDKNPYQPAANNFPKTPSSFSPQPNNFPKLASSFNPQPTRFTKQPSSFNPQPITLTKIPSNPFNPQPSSAPKAAIHYQPTTNSNRNGWALTKFLFEVDLGMDTNIGFQNCEGLESSVEPYEFRDGNSTEFFKQKRPGIVSFGNITLKKGMFANDKALYKWYKNVSTGALFGDMRTVKIRLLDTDHGIAPLVLFTWELKKAFVVKYAPTNMDAHDGEEIAIEELEIACQSWTMS